MDACYRRPNLVGDVMNKTILPVAAGNYYDMDIKTLGHSGEGVGRYRDFTVFVPYALPGENVTVLIETVKKNYAKGRLSKINQVSAQRMKSRCAIYEECGGCQLQHLDYKAQLETKRQIVVDAVTRIGKIPDVVIHPVIGSAEPWYYRNKMQFPVGRDKGKVAVGCFAQGSHKIINTKHCFIQHDINNKIADAVRNIAAQLSIEPYDEQTGRGVLRHVIGRVGVRTGEVMVVLVTATDTLPQQQQVVARLREAIPGLVSIIHNSNPKKTNVIMGTQSTTIWGRPTIKDRLGEFEFNISDRSFFQVNTPQAEILYNKALEYAGLSGEETVIDAYCGTGTISLFLARKAKKVYGIEIVAPAIEDAIRNADDNQVTNTEFIVGDAVDIMPRLYRQGVRPDVIVVDPPRAGCAAKVLETFVKMNPKRIVYVSCNPASLARDLAILNDSNYISWEIQPVDMFPNTFHVECVVLLKRK